MYGPGVHTYTSSHGHHISVRIIYWLCFTIPEATNHFRVSLYHPNEEVTVYGPFKHPHMVTITSAKMVYWLHSTIPVTS